jgi:probable HAF family extracellular repeat protein
MKFNELKWVKAISLLALLGTPSWLVGQQSDATPSFQRYVLTDLGPKGNPFSQATGINNPGLVTGLDTTSDGTQHAVLWYKGLFTDIGDPALGGPNSGAGGVNRFGLVMGGAETSAEDRNHENFCGYGTGKQCLVFSWHDGVMTKLPTLGGINAAYGGINNLGEISGYAENNVRDPQCPKKVRPNGTGPQILDFKPVIWGPKPREIRELRLPKGDTVGLSSAINDAGQAVGMTGTCGNTEIAPLFAAPHAVLWEKDRTLHDLGNLGSTGNPEVIAYGNGAIAINNSGWVAGVSALPKIKNAECPATSIEPKCFPFHPFLWTAKTGMHDLGVLPGDFVGAGLGINNRGEMVGASISSPGPSSGNPRAFLWRNGVMRDLNTLIPRDSPLYLLTAFAINDWGLIVGFGVQMSTGDLHGFLLTPCNQVHVQTASCTRTTDETASEADEGVVRPAVVLSQSAREQLAHRVPFGPLGAQLMGR